MPSQNELNSVSASEWKPIKSSSNQQLNQKWEMVMGLLHKHVNANYVHKRKMMKYSIRKFCLPTNLLYK